MYLIVILKSLTAGNASNATVLFKRGSGRSGLFSYRVTNITTHRTNDTDWSVTLFSWWNRNSEWSHYQSGDLCSPNATSCFRVVLLICEDVRLMSVMLDSLAVCSVHITDLV